MELAGDVVAEEVEEMAGDVVAEETEEAVAVAVEVAMMAAHLVKGNVVAVVVVVQVVEVAASPAARETPYRRMQSSTPRLRICTPLSLDQPRRRRKGIRWLPILQEGS